MRNCRVEEGGRPGVAGLPELLGWCGPLLLGGWGEAEPRRMEKHVVENLLVGGRAVRRVKLTGGGTGGRVELAGGGTGGRVELAGGEVAGLDGEDGGETKLLSSRLLDLVPSIVIGQHLEGGPLPVGIAVIFSLGFLFPTGLLQQTGPSVGQGVASRGNVDCAFLCSQTPPAYSVNSDS